ncbi:hypothetical protein [Methylobacterium oxalidis]|uniref:Lipoprotein n=1 Tax=Methylobacterium oxalidis TaxID=944322 RepID=A0A512J4J6_9HYPH|nr:hypothetical protein [Methylobacterium oxalidis]GEP04852.1 hypothetical protein MOX02_28900 [Methylobacterium oxalidis]GJE30139.1 hypothetical protein LDDCCGHA_0302 [Methylobacterium oxalidis]GLS66983.1 hypothetical protein GCM10007888_53660 [Methylobacterium oxalidis]
MTTFVPTSKQIILGAVAAILALAATACAPKPPPAPVEPAPIIKKG